MTRIAIVALFALGACKSKGPPPEPKQTPPAGSGSAAGSAVAEAKPTEPPPPAQTWDKFTSKDGGFSIELPGKAEERDQSGMKMVGAEFGATPADPRTAMCGAAYMQLPAVDDPKTILDGATARHKQNATVIEDKEITLGKYPGRSLIVENTSHRKWMRVYLVDKMIYLINCGGPFDRSATDGPIALKALASFALTK